MDDQIDSACLLLLNLPNTSFCGIDLLSFTTSTRFRGIRNLPPGWHFVFAGATNSFSLRQGAWFYVEEPKNGDVQVLVMKWNPSTEELNPETDERELSNWRSSLTELWKDSLTPYRQSAKQVENSQEGDVVEESHDWQSLTDSISSALLSRITRSSNGRYWCLTSASSDAQDYDSIPGLTSEEVSKALKEHELQLLPINLKKTWPEGAVGRARTEAAKDRSWALGELVKEHCDKPSDVLGEMQFCFIMVLTLNNNSCLEQWRRLISLLMTCESASVKQPSFFAQVLSLVKLQLQHCNDAEGGLFDLSDEGGTLLKSLLRRFRSGLERQSGSQAKTDVMDELDDLEDYAKTDLGWYQSEPHLRRGLVELEDGERVEMDMNGADEEDETGEYAPVMVDLTPEQLEQLSGADETLLSHNEKVMLKAQRHGTGSVEEPEDGEDSEVDIEDLDERY